MKFVSRRSPWMIPRPVEGGSAELPREPLPRLAFGAAWRPRALAGALAGGLSRVRGGEPQRAVHRRIGQCLEASEAFAAAAAELGVGEGAGGVETLLQARLESLPLPAASSWAEVALADVLFGEALDRLQEDLTGSTDEGLAEAARAARGSEAAFGVEVVASMAGDPKNRECLQILVDRWLPAGVRAFGRPGSPAELQLLEGRIKPRSADAGLSRFLAEVEELLAGLGLWLPDAERMGVVVPNGWKPRPWKRSGPKHEARD